jgi:ComF family protein
VPLHPVRLRQRGFNQSLLLAQELGTLLNLPVEEAIARTRRTQPQVRLGAGERLSNVAGAFVMRAGHDVEDRSFLLVDDVITTGSTLAGCAEALRAAGALSVSAATIAREM